MNPYDANFRNVSARLGAWALGMVRLYRRPLIVILLASVTTAVGVNASQEESAAAIVLAETATTR
jgi:hypothetical protein